jgi:hypothetical protein
MWCDKCQADVAAVASSDNQRLHCTACGTELPRSAVSTSAALPSASAASRGPLSDPRELLARWAREDALGSLDLSPPVVRTPMPEPRPQLRFDPSHAGLNPQPQVVERIAARGPAPAVPAPVVSQSPIREIEVHPPHALAAPHFQPVPATPEERSSKRLTTVGQLCAYFGVAGLFVGTILILLSYFGGITSYATTGWLVVTAGQMLLFLGVITLVSGGMEQTTQEVARRIDTLGDRLVRIEQATLAPRPPEARPRQEAAVR